MQRPTWTLTLIIAILLLLPGIKGKAGEVIVNNDSIYTDTIDTDYDFHFRINSAYVTYKGLINNNGTYDELTVHLNNGSVIDFSSEAKIDNNQDSLVYAKTIMFPGTDYRKDSIIFSEGFVADHTGYDTNYAPENQPNWHSDGFSSMRPSNITLVHRHSQSHPSIHKKTPDGDHTHHGLIGFSGICTWIIEKNDQFNDCQITWDSTFTLITQKDLRFKGVYENGVQAFWGTEPQTGENDTMIKEGNASLIMNGAQMYNDGTVMDIREGQVIFKWNPALRNDTLSKSIGLNLLIDPGAGCMMNHTRADIESLTSNGLLSIDSGRLVATGDIEFEENSRLQLKNDFSGYTIRTKGMMTLNGQLSLDYHKKGDTIQIVRSEKEIQGTFKQVTEGFDMVYQSHKVFAIQTNTRIKENLTHSSNKLQFYNYPKNPYLLANSNLGRISVALIDMTGSTIATQETYVSTNQKIYLTNLFDNIPSHQVMLIHVFDKTNHYSFKYISQ